MVDYILRKSLKPNELAKVEREYNKILKVIFKYQT